MIADFADSYAAGETPVPCVRCNQTVKFADLTALARRAGGGAAGDRALCPPHRRRRTARNCTAPRTRRATRAGSCSPPRASSLAFCAVPAGRHAGQARRCGARRSGSGWRWPPSRTARTSASCPSGGYADVVARLRPGCRGDAGDIVDRDGPGAGPARRHRALHGWAGQAARRAAMDRGAAAGGGGDWSPARGASWSARATTGHRHGAAARGELAGRRRRRTPLRCQVKLRAREAPHGASVRATPDGRRGARWTRPRCRRPDRPACSTTASACWAAGSSGARTPERRLTWSGAADYLPCPSGRMAA